MCDGWELPVRGGLAQVPALGGAQELPRDAVCPSADIFRQPRIWKQLGQPRQKARNKKCCGCFKKRGNGCQLCVSAGKARGLRSGPVENRETLGTANVSERTTWPLLRVAQPWAGRGWAGLCGVWGPCHLHPSPTEGLSFLPPALLRSLAQRPAGWGVGRPGWLCLGLECVLLQLKYSDSCQEPGH